ncbi:hypothetical protein ACIQVC_07550 [Streptomyces sp. NPDC101112]|uniref:hypothetical protein n=1 Tax=Streptomyces sp. NPDC101112 TaxID=3366105 RepID=UPI0038223905
MTRRFRRTGPEQDLRHWFEVGDDGRVLRQISFRGGETAALVAADPAEREQVRQVGGELAVQLYEVVYGTAWPGPVAETADAVPVTELEFDLAWGRARSHRQCDVRHDSGPVPVGRRLPGTFTVSPWGPGATGVFVDLGLSVPGFVDALILLRAECQWPPDGTPAVFEVIDIRMGNGSCQLRLRPTATPAPGEPWPSPGPR